VKKLHEWKNEIARRGLRGFLRLRENGMKGRKRFLTPLKPLIK